MSEAPIPKALAKGPDMVTFAAVAALVVAIYAFYSLYTGIFGTSSGDEKVEVYKEDVIDNRKRTRLESQRTVQWAVGNAFMALAMLGVASALVMLHFQEHIASALAAAQTHLGDEGGGGVLGLMAHWKERMNAKAALIVGISVFFVVALTIQIIGPVFDTISDLDYIEFASLVLLCAFLAFIGIRYADPAIGAITGSESGAVKRFSTFAIMAIAFWFAMLSLARIITLLADKVAYGVAVSSSEILRMVISAAGLAAVSAYSMRSASQPLMDMVGNLSNSLGQAGEGGGGEGLAQLLALLANQGGAGAGGGPGN